MKKKKTDGGTLQKWDMEVKIFSLAEKRRAVLYATVRNDLFSHMSTSVPDTYVSRTSFQNLLKIKCSLF